ncbi:MAG: hypothetical protein AAF483_06445, partial [Planctomycetota bacterium]
MFACALLVSAIAAKRGLCQEVGAKKSIEDGLDGLSPEQFAELIPIYTKHLRRNDSSLKWRVLNLLKKFDFSAVKDVGALEESLLGLLDDNQHATRSLAIDILTELAEQGFPVESDGLNSASARKRAAIATLLRRTNQLTVEQAVELAEDKDPRVRVVVARMQSGDDERLLAAKLRLLNDPHAAVASVAIQSIASTVSLEEAEQTAEALCKPLQRIALREDAIHALGQLGTFAKSALPAMARGIDDNYAPYPFSLGLANPFDFAIIRIGKPDLQDLGELEAVLASGSTFKSLNVLRILEAYDNAPNASILNLVRRNVERDVNSMREYLEEHAEEHRLGRPYPREIRKMRQCIIMGSTLYWLWSSDYALLIDLDHDDLSIKITKRASAERLSSFIDKMLEADADVNFISYLLYSGGSVSSKWEPILRERLANRKDREYALAKIWCKSLSERTPDLERVLIDAYETGRIKIRDFAGTVRRLNLRSTEIEELFVKRLKNPKLGVRMNGGWAPVCEAEYFGMSSDRNVALRNILELSEPPDFWVVEELGKIDPDLEGIQELAKQVLATEDARVHTLGTAADFYSRNLNVGKKHLPQLKATFARLSRSKDRSDRT